jgi:hypothetical protein
MGGMVSMLLCDSTVGRKSDTIIGRDREDGMSFLTKCVQIDQGREVIDCFDPVVV